MSTKNETPLELTDPVAHPHYPQRPRQAARLTYTVMSEPSPQSTSSGEIEPSPGSPLHPDSASR